MKKTTRKSTRLSGMYLKMFFLHLGLFILSLSCPLFSKPLGSGAQNTIPVNGNFLGPQAILFTPLPSAACLNAATLANTESFTSLELAYSPKRGDTPQNFYTGIATTSKSYGFGFGYFGSLGASKSVNGGFVGLGFRSDLSRYGISYRTLDFAAGGVGNFDLSYVYHDPTDGIAYGGVVYGINESQQLSLGFGYTVDKTFNLELDIVAPQMKQITSGDYIIKAASNFNLSSKISGHLEFDFHTKPSKIAPIIGFTYSLSDFAHGLIQYSTPNVWSLGVSLTF